MMFAHLRANLLLLVLTVALCCVAYPAALWAVGQAAFPYHANGRLIAGADGKPVGSALIAHEVKGAHYFQPRPSATAGSAFNGAASGASNYGPSNPALRDRVARSLAPLVKFGAGARKGELVAPDVVKWLSEPAQDALRQRLKLKDDADSAEMAAAAFAPWRAAHPDVVLESVPADLVTASASGLDPHITLDGALYQLPTVAQAWAAQTGGDAATIQRAIETLVRERAHQLTFGVAVVNVVEVNLELYRKYAGR